MVSDHSILIRGHSAYWMVPLMRPSRAPAAFLMKNGLLLFFIREFLEMKKDRSWIRKNDFVRDSWKHPCLTDPSKSTPSKSPSKRGAEIDVPKQTRPWKRHPQAHHSKNSSPSKKVSNPQANIVNRTSPSTGSSHPKQTRSKPQGSSKGTELTLHPTLRVGVRDPVIKGAGYANRCA